MNTKNLLIFALGCITGAIGMKLYLEDRYTKMLEDDEFEDDSEDESESSVTAAESRKYEDKPSIDEYAREIAKNHYDTDYNGISKPKKPDHGEYSDPYVIEPEEYSNDGEYEAIDLSYYQNGVVCDELDEPLENQEDIVGTDFVNHFGEYEEDIVHVRNDKLKADYEITYIHSDYIAE